MATRCSVLVKSGDDIIQFYRHWDGYPDGAGKDLENIIEEFNHTPEKTWKALKTMIEDYNGSFKFEGSTTSDWGDPLSYLPSLPCDIEWLYTIEVENNIATLKTEKV